MYLVRLRRDILGYEEFFGPIASCGEDIYRNSQRFARPGWSLSWFTVRMATEAQMQHARENMEARRKRGIQD